jgi:hypothetical protein
MQLRFAMKFRFVSLPVIAALLQGCGATMLITTCDSPRISNFGVPSSYIVMLPYRYGGHSDRNRDSALQINQITRLQALQGAVEMPATQITFVEGDAQLPDDPKCGIENVYDRVVENRSGLFWRRPYHSAVFLWGEIYDDDDGIIVQSHMRVFWNGSSDREIEVSVDSPALVRPLRFGGDLPSDTISFPAQKFTLAAQERLATSITASLEVRSAPSLDAGTVKLPKKFSAVSWKRPWLKLQGRDLSTAWLLIDESGLKAGPVLPETLFAKAMASYLNFRVKRDDSSYQYAVESLTNFRTALGPGDDPLLRVPLAVADVIEGTLGLPTKQYPSSVSVNADQIAMPMISAQSKIALAEAARRLPSNGEVLNLAAISRIPGCCEGSDAGARILEIQRILERAEVLEQGNPKVARNLLNWYSYLATVTDEKLPFTRVELLERTRQATNSLAAWASRGSF